jgi:hypothetical protein
LWLFLLTLLGGIWCVLSGYARWTAVPQEDTATWLMLGGTGLLGVSVICLCVLIWRSLRGNPPWGRLLLLAVVLNYLVGRLVVGAYPWAAPIDSAIGWALLIGLVLRWRQLRRRSELAQSVRHDTAADESGGTDVAARWAAGAFGEQVVAGALGRLGDDHVVIHNLPLVGRGDVDHVVVGPAGVVVVETKYLAGHVVCGADGIWWQLKRDQERQIADPAVQVQRAAAGVAAILRQHGLADVPVYPILVMAHPRTELDVARSSVLVARPAELVPQLQRLEQNSRRLDGPRVIAAANSLLARTELHVVHR